jgi:hypothetical protein
MTFTVSAKDIKKLIKQVKSVVAKPNYRQLTNREHDILRTWETVPKELWSEPDLFIGDETRSWMTSSKASKIVMADGVEALGFSIQRCFDFCLEIIERLDLAESAHLDSVAPLLALLQEHGKVCHYVYCEAGDEEDEYGRQRARNEVVVFKKEYDQHYYGQAIRQTNWIRKWEARFGKHSFSSHENSLIGYRSKVETIKKQSFVLSEYDYDDVQIYPEITQYLKTSRELHIVQMKFWAMARACVRLFDLDKATEDSMNFMPCRIQLGDRSFYLQVTKDWSDMSIAPQLESNWSLDGTI